MDNNGFQYETQNEEIQQSGQSPDGLAVASLVCGIISILTMCCCRWFGIILGVVAIVTASISKDEFGNKSTMAKVGFWLGIAGIVIAVIGIVLSFIGLYQMQSFDYNAYFG